MRELNEIVLSLSRDGFFVDFTKDRIVQATQQHPTLYSWDDDGFSGFLDAEMVGANFPGVDPIIFEKVRNCLQNTS